MDKNGLFIAAMLDSASKAYAAGIATRILETTSDDGVGFVELGEEAELRVRLLAESMAAGRPALFVHEVSWLKVLYASRGKDWRSLATELDCMEAELEDRLPGTVSGMVSAYTGAARDALPGAPETIDGFLDEGPLQDVAQAYLGAILEGRARDAAEAVIAAAEGGVGIEDIHDRVIVPVQRELGRRWHLGEIRVADEHLGTRTTEEVLTLLRVRIPAPQSGARRVLAAGTPGSYHDVGLRLAADRLRLAGWDAILLGADTPVDEFPRSVTQYGVDLVAVSLPMTLNIREAHAVIVALRAESSVPVVVGGGPLAIVEDLWQVLGADAGASAASDVVAAADRALASRA